MININKEVLAKARQAKSFEGLFTLAKESGIKMTQEQAKYIYSLFIQNTGKHADDEFISGTDDKCYNEEDKLMVSGIYSCGFWTCKKCGNTESVRIICKDEVERVCKSCNTHCNCTNCSYCFSQSGISLCCDPSRKH